MSIDVAIEKRTNTTISLKPPEKWKVVLHNDDTTPMDYVIEVLMLIFGHDFDAAKDITLTIHNSGRGTAGIYPYEIAEQKCAETLSDSRNKGHDLTVDLEKE
jgi:ATP-dependent Clp protease adaptor protein ClpS